VAERFDVVVVGAGPAGAAAGLVLARAGRSVCIVERGLFPGAKNVYGGVVYPRILESIVPRWWEEAPVQRFITRRSTMVMTATQALTVDYRTAAWGSPPYNGVTALRPEWDRWMAGHAERAGAVVLCSTVATGLLRDGARVVGVRTDRAEGELEAQLVVACDGVNSFLAKEAGLYPEVDTDHVTLGVKEVLHLPKEEIDRRFAVTGREGVDIEILGATRGVPGGGFLYTNYDTLSVGVILQLSALGRSGRRPEEFVAELKEHPGIAPLVAEAELKEYSAHLIPEGGYDTMPRLVTDGMLVAGDAACMTLAAGIWLEGVNLAVGAGIAAAETAIEALGRGDVSAAGLAGYRRRLESGFVLVNHAKLRSVPSLVLSDRMQFRYPGMMCALAEAIFTVGDPEPKPGLRRIFRRALSGAGVRLRHLLRDTLVAIRSFG
jgi:electron transfer flavoprotein-quinone oxidoreductase